MPTADAPDMALAIHGLGSAKSYERFLQDSFPKEKFNPGVILRAQQRYTNRVILCLMTSNAHLAWEVYQDTLMLPSTTTRDLLLKRDGIRLGGPLFEGSALTQAYRGTQAYVLKGLDNREAANARYVLALSAVEPSGWFRHVTTFDLLMGGHDVTSPTGAVDVSGRSFMLMPKYFGTLEEIPALEPQNVSRLWEQLSAALDDLHAKGLAFMDVKPANIAFTERGDFYLIDVGSAAPFGFATNATMAYIPTDVAPRRLAAHPRLDWWMLAVTLCQKGCDDINIEPGSRKWPYAAPPTGVVMQHMSDHLLEPTAEGAGKVILATLQAKLASCETVYETGVELVRKSGIKEMVT